VLDAVRGIALSPYHMGQNDDHRLYNDITLVLRNAAKTEEFRDIARGARPTPTIRRSKADERQARIAAIMNGDFDDDDGPVCDDPGNVIDAEVVGEDDGE
jgi:hypothetical protein